MKNILLAFFDLQARWLGRRMDLLIELPLSSKDAAPVPMLRDGHAALDTDADPLGRRPLSRKQVTKRHLELLETGLPLSDGKAAPKVCYFFQALETAAMKPAT